MKTTLWSVVLALAISGAGAIYIQCKCNHVNEKPCCEKEKKRTDCCCPHIDASQQNADAPDCHFGQTCSLITNNEVNTAQAALPSRAPAYHRFDCGPPIYILTQKLTL